MRLHGPPQPSARAHRQARGAEHRLPLARRRPGAHPARRAVAQVAPGVRQGRRPRAGARRGQRRGRARPGDRVPVRAPGRPLGHQRRADRGRQAAARPLPRGHPRRARVDHRRAARALRRVVPGRQGAMTRVADLPGRLLLGSGPSPVPRRVLDALAQPTIGHLDPAFGALIDEVADGLRATMRTANRVTFGLSATGSGGMQAMVDTLIAPGDRVVCGVHGAFGARMADALGRAGAHVVSVETEWGRAIAPERLIEATAAGPTRAVFVVHGETSTGVAQPLDGLADAARAADALLLVDCVTSLAGHPLDLDAAGADAAFSGTQKCLNVPPGLAPFTVGERVEGRLQRRSWYFDLEAILGYWKPEGGGARAYHHTAPINMIYALREALTIVHEEGLEARWARHATAHEALRAALQTLGFERLAPDGEQLHPLLAVRVPDDIDEAAVRSALLERHAIEVSGGVGRLAGKAWRIGVMGEGARIAPQRALVAALATELGRGADEPLAALEDGWR